VEELSQMIETGTHTDIV